MRSAKNRNNEAASSKVDRTNNEVIETDLDAEVKTSEAAKEEWDSKKHVEQATTAPLRQ